MKYLVYNAIMAEHPRWIEADSPEDAMHKWREANVKEASERDGTSPERLRLLLATVQLPVYVANNTDDVTIFHGVIEADKVSIVDPSEHPAWKAAAAFRKDMGDRPELAETFLYGHAVQQLKHNERGST